MLDFHYDETPITKEESDYIGAYILEVNSLEDFTERLVESLKEMTCCKNCKMGKLMRRALVILNILKPMDCDDRFEFVKHVDGEDFDFLCKYVVGFIDCEASLENAEIKKDEQQSMYYINLMNTLKHMYAVKTRYWRLSA